MAKKQPKKNPAKKVEEVEVAVEVVEEAPVVEVAVEAVVEVAVEAVVEVEVETPEAQQIRYRKRRKRALGY